MYSNPIQWWTLAQFLVFMIEHKQNLIKIYHGFDTFYYVTYKQSEQKEANRKIMFGKAMILVSL